MLWDPPHKIWVVFLCFLSVFHFVDTEQNMNMFLALLQKAQESAWFDVWRDLTIVNSALNIRIDDGVVDCAAGGAWGVSNDVSFLFLGGVSFWGFLSRLTSLSSGCRKDNIQWYMILYHLSHCLIWAIITVTIRPEIKAAFVAQRDLSPFQVHFPHPAGALFAVRLVGFKRDAHL